MANPSINLTTMAPSAADDISGLKSTAIGIEHVSDPQPPTASSAQIMRSREDDISVFTAFKRYKLITFVAFAAAFSASLDGYQISLNGGIVSNKGFIHQMAGPTAKILDGKYVSAWGGIQSAGQFLGQVFLQFGTNRLGRKPALLILWVFLVASIFAESFAHNYQAWLIAKLFSGIGVGMLQCTVPVYLSEMAPTQLKGFLINAYTFWFTIGQLMGNVALNRMSAAGTYWRIAVYTQWAMIGGMLFIFLLLPETPWWLVEHGKMGKAQKVLLRYNGHLPGYNVNEVLEIMNATIEHERYIAKKDKQEGVFAVFQGTNFIRFIIASWPKIVQQFVGLTVYNTYSTYFFQAAGQANPFQDSVILSCMQILSMIFVCCSTDVFGRRPLTVYGYAITTLAVLCLGIVGTQNYKTKSLGSLLVVFCAIATFTTTGASAIGYNYAAEIPSQRLRAQTAGWALGFSNLIAIMFSFVTPLMINGTAKWGVKTGFFFAGTGTCAVVAAWFLLPEIARRTPAEIDEMFEKKVSPRKFGRYMTEVETHAHEQQDKEDHLAGA